MNRRHPCDDHDEVDSHVPLLNDNDRSVPVLRDDPISHSPAVSTVSAQSQELQYIFDPCPGQADLESEADAHSDYSHVNIRPKPCHSDGGNYIARPPPPPYNHRYEAIANARSGIPYGFQQQGAVLNNGVHRFRAQVSAANASLEDATANDSSRRRSWSPLQNAAGNRGARSCYSSNMVDWDTLGQHMNPPAYDSSANYPPLSIPPPPQGQYPQGPSHGHPQGYLQNYHQSHIQRQPQGPLNNLSDAENLPPRLAPVSGVLSEKLSRNLIRPIAFKPAYAKPQIIACKSCREDLDVCACQGHALLKLQSPAQTAARHDGQLYARSPSLRSVSTSQMSVYTGGIIESSSNTSYRSVVYNNEISNHVDDSPGVNVDQSPTRKLPTISGSVDVLAGTPSPSDSGVGELEAMLKEREAEILTLRQVMDRNERAIFQVYEEKKSRWQQDLCEIKAEYENKLKTQQEKASRLEQVLSQGPYPKQLAPNNMVKYSNLQAEKEAVMVVAAAARNGQHPADAFHSESENNQTSLLAPAPKKHQSQSSRSSRSSRSSSVHSGDLEAEVTEEIAMKNTEIMALRAQLRGLQGQLQDKDRALVALREESASKSEELQLAREQIDRLLLPAHQDSSYAVHEECTQTSFTDFKNRDSRHIDYSAEDENEEDEMQGTTPLLQPAVVSDQEYVFSLEKQIDALRVQLQEAEGRVETERLQWLEEKNKVIRYQKQLQLNYVQMQRKNTALEAEVEQLTLELERRDLKLSALNGEESVC